MLDHLEDNIHRVIADIRPQMLEKVIENWTSRLDYIRASRGSPMPEIIFKIHSKSPNVNTISWWHHQEAAFTKKFRHFVKASPMETLPRHLIEPKFVGGKDE
ncbi:hypothetical protein TNCV_145591 [Trichonephila clavipes]|nr:hypothetical protein TNCV_145591 [Trichonephila clavipes]